MGLAPEALDFALDSFKVNSQAGHKMARIRRRLFEGFKTRWTERPANAQSSSVRMFPPRFRPRTCPEPKRLASDCGAGHACALASQVDLVDSPVEMMDHSDFSISPCVHVPCLCTTSDAIGESTLLSSDAGDDLNELPAEC